MRRVALGLIEGAARDEFPPETGDLKNRSWGE